MSLVVNNVSVRPWAERHSSVEDCDLIVNTTNQGMAGQPPLDLSLDIGSGLTGYVTDIIYVPLETKLITDAKSRGLANSSVVSGCYYTNLGRHGERGLVSTQKLPKVCAR